MYLAKLGVVESHDWCSFIHAFFVGGISCAHTPSPFPVHRFPNARAKVLERSTSLFRNSPDFAIPEVRFSQIGGNLRLIPVSAEML